MENRLNPSLAPANTAVLLHEDSTPEVWRPVVGYEGSYEVSDSGRVRSLERIEVARNQFGRFARGRSAKTKKPFYTNGCARVTLYRGGQGKKWAAPHLVLLAFVGPPPGEVGRFDGQFSCNHVNGDCGDDRLSNLEWLLNEEHRQHTVDNHLHAARESHARAKLTWDDVREIRRSFDAGEAGQTVLAERHGVSKGNIDFIVKRQTWIEDYP